MGSSNQAPVDVENPQTPLATSIRRKFDTLSPLSSERCIYRVPERLRSVKEKAYTPHVVSIGPLHHGKDGLKAMEEHKMRYLRDYIQRTNVSLEDYINIVKEKEPKLRSCYAETIGFTSDEFVKIILVDSAFIIELLLRDCIEEFVEETYDPIFGKPWMLSDIFGARQMLENQLPFFMLVDLFDPKKRIIPPTHMEGFSIIKLTYEFFISWMDLKWTKENLEQMSSTTILHLVDFLRNLFVLGSPRQGRACKDRSIPSTTKLHKAGVKFEASSSKNLLHIQFENGILKIPPLDVHDKTERVIRNLVAFEQCHYIITERYLSDYAVFMDYLVNDPKDEELLVKYGILSPGDIGKACDAINQIGAKTGRNLDKFYFAETCKNLNDYYNSSWYKWKANLKQEYFKTPWVTISVIAACFVVVLTTIQAVCSIISVV